MKLKSLFLLAFAAVLALAVPRTGRAAEVSFEFFHDALSPMGEWIEVGDYGYCWRPSGVDEDWAPYADGYWSYTDAGWTWVSYEDFGGIVYHYGRWVKVDDEGWCWVPDYEWGPAWVSWRHSDDYVGWAPLPVEARWQPERGISVWADTSYDIGPSHYSFCHTRDFGAPVLRPLILRRSENIVFIGNTVNITNITYNRRAGCVFNGGLNYARVNRFQARPIPALKLVRNTNITVVNNRIVNNNVTINNFNSVQQGNQLTVLAPRMVRPQQAQVAALMRPQVTKVIPAQKVSRGWKDVPAEQRTAIRTTLAKQTEGKTPETTAATPLKDADLKVVPVKADPKARIPGSGRVVAKGTPLPAAPLGDKPGSVTGTPVTGAPTPNTIPLDPGAGPKTAREKAAAQKLGKGANPTPAVAQEIPVNPAAEKATAATPMPAAIKGGKPIAKKPVKGAIPAPSTEAQEPSAISVAPPAITKGKKPGKIPPPTPSAENTEVIPSVPPTVPKGKVSGVHPGIAKPFNAPANDNNAPGESVVKPAGPSAAETAAARRNAAADAAKKQNAAQEAARERATMQKQQIQKENAARNNAQEAAAAAAARQRMLQQQQNAADQAPRKRQVEPSQVQQQNQQQEMQRARADQAAEARQNAAAAQHSQAAATARQAQAQAAARQQAAAQMQQRNVAPPQPRNQPQAVPRNLQVQPQQQKVQGKPGKRPLTPEEVAALKNAR